MERQEWLESCEWLAPVQASQAPAAVTAFAGAASLHVSCAEQLGSTTEFRGPLAPDAVHLSFLSASPSQDPMQLRLRVDVSLPPGGTSHAAHAPGLPPPQLSPPPPPQLQQQQRRHLCVVLCFDGQPYRLLLAQATRLVLPQQLAARLPVTTHRLGAEVPVPHHRRQQQQQQQQGQQHPQQQLGAAGPGTDGSATSTQAAQHTFICPAPASPLPFLTLIFPHVCLNIYPLGWKAAAAHVSQEHDASELARLAQLLAECWQQQRLLGVQAEPPSAERPAAVAGQSAAPPSWHAAIQDWRAGISALSATAQDLPAAPGSGPAAGLSNSCQSSRLAALARGLLEQRRLAAAQLPAQHSMLQQAQVQVAGLAAQAVGCSSGRAALHELAHQLTHQQQLSEAVTAGWYLAGCSSASQACGQQASLAALHSELACAATPAEPGVGSSVPADTSCRALPYIQPLCQ